MVGRSSTVQVSTGKPARCRRRTTFAVAGYQAIVAPSADAARTRAMIRPAWPRAQATVYRARATRCAFLQDAPPPSAMRTDGANCRTTGKVSLP